MESQFHQPKQVINVEVNKQSIARNFGLVIMKSAMQKSRTLPVLSSMSM